MILSGYQFMVKSIAAQRPSLSNLWDDVFPYNGPNPKSLIEISGAPETGKRIVLNKLMAKACLSTYYGGKYSQVIFVDMTHKVDENSFKRAIQNSMNDIVTVCSQRTIEDFRKYCQSIIILSCYTPDQFEFLFEDIEELLWDHKEISMLAIDGLDSFYWDDCNNHLQRMSTHYKKQIQRLKTLCQEHNICCAYTVDVNYVQTKSNACSYFKPLIDHKLKVIRKSDGKRYLNDIPIDINFNGMEFNIGSTISK